MTDSSKQVKVAARDLMSDPAVEKEMAAIAEGIDGTRMEALMREAGVKPPASK